MVVGTFISPEIAVGGFHSLAGWLGFNLVGARADRGARRRRFFALPGAGRDRAAIEPDGGVLDATAGDRGNGDGDWGLLRGFDRYYPLRVVAAAVVFWCYRKAYRDLRLAWNREGFGIGIAVFALWMALEPNPPFTGTG